MALGAVSEIPELPVTGSITRANVANGDVVEVVVAMVVVVCAPTFPPTANKVAKHAKLVATASCFVRLRRRVPTAEVGGEVVTSDTEGHLYAFGEDGKVNSTDF